VIRRKSFAQTEPDARANMCWFVELNVYHCSELHSKKETARSQITFHVVPVSLFPKPVVSGPRHIGIDKEEAMAYATFVWLGMNQ
jgi:hypothetical protein